MKKIILALVLTFGLFRAVPALAEENCVQVQVYGGGVGVVCGEKTHEPVPADLAGVGPLAIGSGLVAASGILALLSRKISSRKVNSAQ